MRDREPAQGEDLAAQQRAADPTAVRPYVGTPYAERYVIAADNLRRRQLTSALLHGRRRTWREQRRIWPSVIAGLMVVALIVAGIAVIGALRTEQQVQRERERQQRASSHPALVVSAAPPADTSHRT